MIDVQRTQRVSRFSVGLVAILGAILLSSCAITQLVSGDSQSAAAAATAASAMPAPTPPAPSATAPAAPTATPAPIGRPVAAPAAAPAATPPAAGTPRPFAEVIKDAKQIPGFLPIWQKDDRTWIEIAPEQLDKPFFLSINMSRGIGERGTFCRV